MLTISSVNCNVTNRKTLLNKQGKADPQPPMLHSPMNCDSVSFGLNSATFKSFRDERFFALKRLLGKELEDVGALEGEPYDKIFEIKNSATGAEIAKLNRKLDRAVRKGVDELKGFKTKDALGLCLKKIHDLSLISDEVSGGYHSSKVEFINRAETRAAVETRRHHGVEFDPNHKYDMENSQHISYESLHPEMAKIIKGLPNGTTVDYRGQKYNVKHDFLFNDEGARLIKGDLNVSKIYPNS